MKSLPYVRVDRNHSDCQQTINGHKWDGIMASNPKLESSQQCALGAWQQGKWLKAEARKELKEIPQAPNEEAHDGQN